MKACKRSLRNLLQSSQREEVKQGVLVSSGLLLPGASAIRRGAGRGWGWRAGAPTLRLGSSFTHTHIQTKATTGDKQGAEDPEGRDR